jgi:hypothetical protein
MTKKPAAKPSQAKNKSPQGNENYDSDNDKKPAAKPSQAKNKSPQQNAEPQEMKDLDELIARLGPTPDVKVPKKGVWPYKANQQVKLSTFPKLNEKEEAALKAFQEDSELFVGDDTPVVKYKGPKGYAVVVTHSLLTLLNTTWVNDEIIEYMVMLSLESNEIRNKKNPKEAIKVLHFNSFFFTQLLQKGHKKCHGEYLFSDHIKRILMKKMVQNDAKGNTSYLSPHHYNKIIFTCNFAGIHWCAFCVYPDRNTIEAYDSLGGPHDWHLKVLYKLMKDWYKCDFLDGHAKMQWKENWTLYHKRESVSKQ